MVINEGIKVGAVWAIMIALIAILGVHLLHETAGAQEPTPSAAEHAVIECGDSPSGHGGSADYPPHCEVENAPTLPQDSPREAQSDYVGDWLTVSENIAQECLTGKADADLRGIAQSVLTEPHEQLLQDAAGDKSIATEASACVRVSVKVEVRGSATIE